METKDPLWVEVEISLALWCSFNNAQKCTCPTQSKLEEASPEALNRLLKALNDNTYSGHWQEFLID